jgi:hypothetical protein
VVISPPEEPVEGDDVRAQVITPPELGPQLVRMALIACLSSLHARGSDYCHYYDSQCVALAIPANKIIMTVCNPCSTSK